MSWTYRSAFTTLEHVIYQLSLSGSSDTDLPTEIDTLLATQYANHTQWLKSLIWEESAYLNNLLDRTYVPYSKTLTIYQNDWRLFGRHREYVLDVSRVQDADILSVSAIIIDGTTITSSYYRLNTLSGYPVDEIIFDRDNVTLPGSYAFDKTITITGIFGYHKSPTDMWVDSLDSIQDGSGINASATSITVTNADALGADGFTRFQTLQYIRIEDEYLQVTAVNTSTNVLTVKRGQLGTTAATHANDTQIDVLVPDDLITQATRRLVVQRFLNPSEQKLVTTTPEGATIQIANETIHLPPRRFVIGSV